MTPNPFSSLQPPGNGSEQIVQAKPAALDEAVEKAYRVYEGLDTPLETFETINLIAALEEQILLPNQINSLLQLIRLGTSPEKLYDPLTGIYISRLIQDSYYVGNNNFVITTEDNNLRFIGFSITGKFYKKLKLDIEGNTGLFCGYWAEHINFNISDDVGYWCGHDSRDSIFTAHNEKAYYLLKDNVRYGRGNTIRLLDTSGEVLKEEHLWD